MPIFVGGDNHEQYDDGHSDRWGERCRESWRYDGCNESEDTPVMKGVTGMAQRTARICATECVSVDDLDAAELYGLGVGALLDDIGLSLAGNGDA